MTSSDLLSLYDGNWLDTSTVVGGLLYAALNRFRVPPGRPLLSVETALDAFNGFAIVPLLLLVFAWYTSQAVEALEHVNRVLVSGAGLIALFALLRST